jgi:hypothetical protein
MHCQFIRDPELHNSSKVGYRANLFPPFKFLAAGEGSIFFPGTDRPMSSEVGILFLGECIYGR